MHFRSKERSSVSVVQVFLSLKPVFHMIATIAEKKNVQRSQRSYRNHSPTIAAITAIAATTIAEMELFLSQGLLSLRSLESGFWYDRCDRWNFFFSAIAAITAIVAIIWKPGIRDRNTYTTLTDDLSLDQKCMDPSQSWVLRKWNSSHNKCVDPSWFSKATTTTMIINVNPQRDFQDATLSSLLLQLC